MATSAGERLGKEVVVLDGTSAVFLSESNLPKPEPYGPSVFDTLYQDYLGRVRNSPNATCFVLDGYTDIQSCRIAALAVVEGSGKPVVALLSFGVDGKLPTGGTDLATAAVILSRLGISALGIAGKGNLAGDLAALSEASQVTTLPLAYCYPGLFKSTGNAQEVTQDLERLIQAGVGVFVACEMGGIQKQGTPAEALSGRPLKSRTVEKALTVASASRWTSVGGGRPTRVIGERINPTGRKKLRETLAAGDMSIVENDARTQTEAGADILDVNVGVPGAEEIPLMERAIMTVLAQSDLPISVDSSDPVVIERGLQVFPGKALINSVNGEEASMSKILPLAKRYGAAIVGLALDESGVPIDCATRVAIAEKIIKRASSLGIPKEDIMIDCLVVTAGAQQEGVVETVKAVREVTQKLGVNSVLGLSNVSFGLPERRALNMAFTSMCIGAGLTAGIVDITNPDMKQTILAADVLTNRDEFAGRYISYFRSLPKPE